uniref:Calcium voltage-gated channel auxiliary subunit gamma 1 n=1 Tax=Bos mutus grunniens TaxID=30521 RepID=A0A8B9XVT3_BOSMU
MSQTKTLKVRVALLCILVGVVLALVAVVTDHWAVLSPHVEHHNTTCEAAHFGLWRICTKRIFVGDKERSCGPITLPGEKNCSYFRHFNPGESSEIFEVTTQKEYSISAAAIAIFSLGFIIVGTLCALLSFRKKRDYLLRPTSRCLRSLHQGSQAHTRAQVHTCTPRHTHTHTDTHMHTQTHMHTHAHPGSPWHTHTDPLRTELCNKLHSVILPEAACQSQDRPP